MSLLSTPDCQIWFPGSSLWELWEIRNGNPELIAQSSSEDNLSFSAEVPGLKILALPTDQQVAFPFVSSAPDREGILQSARLNIEKQGAGFDCESIMVEAVAGSPPKVLVRIDAPLGRFGMDSHGDLLPDIVVPAATLLPLEKDGLAIWEEFGKRFVAFDRDGKTIYYDLINSVGGEIADEIYRLIFKLQGEGIIRQPVSFSAWCDIPSQSISERLNIPGHQESRPAPVRFAGNVDGLKPQWLRESRFAVDVEAKAKKKFLFGAISIGSIALIACILMVISFLQTNFLKQEIARLSPTATKVEKMKAEWEEVSVGVDPSQSHLEVGGLYLPFPD